MTTAQKGQWPCRARPAHPEPILRNRGPSWRANPPPVGFANSASRVEFSLRDRQAVSKKTLSCPDRGWKFWRIMYLTKVQKRLNVTVKSERQNGGAN